MGLKSLLINQQMLSLKHCKAFILVIHTHTRTHTTHTHTPHTHTHTHTHILHTHTHTHTHTHKLPPLPPQSLKQHATVSWWIVSISRILFWPSTVHCYSKPNGIVVVYYCTCTCSCSCFVLTCLLKLQMWYKDCHNELTLAHVMDKAGGLVDQGRVVNSCCMYCICGGMCVGMNSTCLRHNASIDLVRRVYRTMCVLGFINVGVYRRSPQVLYGILYSTTHMHIQLLLI